MWAGSYTVGMETDWNIDSTEKIDMGEIGSGGQRCGRGSTSFPDWSLNRNVLQTRRSCAGDYRHHTPNR